MMITAIPLNEINQQATQVLYREVGIVNTVRFFNQFTIGYGNYTEERRILVENLTRDEMMVDIKQRCANKSKRA
jgi:hypothetical protein